MFELVEMNKGAVMNKEQLLARHKALEQEQAKQMAKVNFISGQLAEVNFALKQFEKTEDVPVQKSLEVVEG